MKLILGTPSNKFSPSSPATTVKTELLQLVPGLTKFRIDEARKHAYRAKPGQLIETLTITRSRLDPVKVDHFLD